MEERYSMLYFLTENRANLQEILQEMIDYYNNGTKIYCICSTQEQFVQIQEEIQSTLKNKGLFPHRGDLIPFQNDKLPSVQEETFLCFHGSVHLISVQNQEELSEFSVADGEIGEFREQLETLAQVSTFDLAQFLAEHSELEKNILLKGGIGTGKSHALLNRLLYLMWWHRNELDNFENSLLILTATTESRQELLRRLRKYKENLRLLTLGSENRKLQIIPESLTMVKYQDLFGKNGYFQNNPDFHSIAYLEKQIATLIYDYVLENGELLEYMIRYGVMFQELEQIVKTFFITLFEAGVDIHTIGQEALGTIYLREKHCAVKAYLIDIIPKIAEKLEETNSSEGDSHVKFGFLKKHCRWIFLDDFDELNPLQRERFFQWCNRADASIFAGENSLITKYTYDYVVCQQEHIFNNRFVLNYQYRVDKMLYSHLKAIETSWFLPEDQENKENQRGSFVNYNEYLSRYPQKFFCFYQISGESQRVSTLIQEIQRVDRRIEYETAGEMYVSPEETSVGILVQNQQQVNFLLEEIVKYGYYPQSVGNHYEKIVLDDMKLLLKALLFCDEVRNIYRLTRSHFFQIEVPFSNFVYLKREGSKQVREYLLGLMSEQMSYLRGGDFIWEEVAESALDYPILPYLEHIFSQTKPWQKYSDLKEEQENYFNAVYHLFHEFQKQKITSLYELLDCLNSDEKTVLSKSEMLKCQQSQREIFVMTVEQSKGLEFGHVILPYCNKKATPQVDMNIYYGSFPKIAYQFLVGHEKDPVSNQYYLNEEEKNRDSEHLMLSLGMGRCLRSFSWIEFLDEEDSWQKSLRKGLVHCENREN